MKTLKLKTLTEEQEKEIIAWCLANPTADIDAKIVEWKKVYSCSEFSIIQAIVKYELSQFK